MEGLTEQQLKDALPKGMRKNVDSLLMIRLNNMIEDDQEWDRFKEGLITFSNVLQTGKYRLDQYINAVQYVGYRVMGYANKDAYRLTFPDRWERLQREVAMETKTDKDVSAYVAAYNKTALVNKIYEQTMIPSYILNQDAFQEAINTQVNIMRTSKSDMARTSAANSVMTHLKPPENCKVELDIGPKTESVIETYKQAMTAFVETQKRLMTQGGDIKQITNAPMRVIEAEVVDK